MWSLLTFRFVIQMTNPVQLSSLTSLLFLFYVDESFHAIANTSSYWSINAKISMRVFRIAGSNMMLECFM